MYTYIEKQLMPEQVVDKTLGFLIHPYLTATQKNISTEAESLLYSKSKESFKNF
jgi:hypothetical protein